MSNDQSRRASHDAAIVYLDPVSGRGTPPDPYEPRLKLTDAATIIGLMSNLFIDASHLLEDLKQPLRDLLPGVEFRFYDKGHMRNSSFPAPATQIEQIARECDAVICAYGHCGSCTGGTVRDAVALARAGSPVVALVTRKFIEEARFLARAGGIPDTPFVFIPHPIAGQDKDFQQAVARAIAPAIIAALTKAETIDAADCLQGTPYAAQVAA